MRKNKSFIIIVLILAVAGFIYLFGVNFSEFNPLAAIGLFSSVKEKESETVVLLDEKITELARLQEEIDLKKEKLEAEKELRAGLELKYLSEITVLAGELEVLTQMVDDFNRQMIQLAGETEISEKSCFVNINTASKEDLQKLTGIGPVLAQRIIDARPFSSVYDLLKVSGIGETTLEKIIEQGCVHVDEINGEEAEEVEEVEEIEKIAETDICPVNVNTASREELQAITGIGPVLAERIIEARPFSSVNDLLRVSGIGQTTLDKIIAQGCAYASGYTGGGSAASSVPAPVKPKPEISLVYPEENQVNKEIEVIFSALNLKNTSYDVKISIKKDGVLSQIYNPEKEGEDKWQSSAYYLSKVFSATSFEGNFILRIREDKEDFRGEAEIIARIRETGKTSFSEFKGKINITDPEEEELEEELDEKTEDPESPINLLSNEFFEDHVNGGFAHWISDHGRIEVSEDALVGDYSMNIRHSYKYSDGKNDDQAFSYYQTEDQEIYYYGEIWVKGTGDIRIGILRPGYSTYNYGGWETIDTDVWATSTHKVKGEREGEEGYFRIQHRQSQDKEMTDLLIGAAWLSIASPPVDWLDKI